MDTTGIWRGEYRFDLNDADGPSPVPFTLRLTQNWLGRVRGTVTDGPGGMPEEGRVIGSCRRGRLRFLKLMPVARVAAEQGTQEVSVFLAAAGHEVEGPIAHPQLLYVGRLASDGRSVTGTWRLGDYVVPLKSGHTARIQGGEGTWSARRSST